MPTRASAPISQAVQCDTGRSIVSRSRHGAIAVFAAVILVILLAFIAFAVDTGVVAVSRTQLQTAADAAAMAAAQSLGLADSQVREAARRVARLNTTSSFTVRDQDIEFGYWDASKRTFTPTAQQSNAVRVTVRRDQTSNGRTSLFFGRVLGMGQVDVRASAIATTTPRDIAFVVDLSGSMNDDTEPCWATDEITRLYGPTTANNVMAKVYQDFRLGSFPGPIEYIGQPLGVARDSYAYAEMTKDNGPLTEPSIPARYRISSGDDEPTRKRKAYSWMIDYQIARLMPNALPRPDSQNTASYAFWERYLDYVIIPQTVRGAPPVARPPIERPPVERPPRERPTSSPPPRQSPPTSPPRQPPPPPPVREPPPPPPPRDPPPPPPPRGGGAAQLPADLHRPSPDSVVADAEMASGSWDGSAAFMPIWFVRPGISAAVPLATLLAGTSNTTRGTPPYNRGTLPPNQYGDRINSSKFNNPNKDTYPSARTNAPASWRNYVGPRTYIQFLMDYGRDGLIAGRKSPLSKDYPAPRNADSVRGRTFNFPPAEQPMHACRRALIAALRVIEDRNAAIPNPNQRDHVAIISFDLKQNGTTVHYGLGGDYYAAMQACVDLQSTTDVGYSTTTEAGLLRARQLLQQGRTRANKVVVLLTDGAPNDWVSPESEIARYMGQRPNRDYYGNGGWWLDAPLMQADIMRVMGWSVWPVGIGLGTNYDFMDRMARMGGTADDRGQSPRGSGDPANYEQRLVDIFEKIIRTPKVHLVD